HLVVGIGSHPRSFSGHHNDRWMVYFCVKVLFRGHVSNPRGH
ncbi:MAG: hypothetical protein JWO62_3724, partial [Acidimicrobiaceae bacterium]|nr:hypothetical protein [Acidimicrobiaceae bacterium]MCU1495960.1 hypothetical protein [Acidimicrobiaceae bacterium]